MHLQYINLGAGRAGETAVFTYRTPTISNSPRTTVTYSAFRPTAFRPFGIVTNVVRHSAHSRQFSEFGIPVFNIPRWTRPVQGVS